MSKYPRDLTWDTRRPQVLRRWLLTLVLLTCAAQPGLCGGLQPGSPWPMYQHDLLHTGRSPFTGPSAPTVKWSFHCTSWVSDSPAIAADGTIYVTCAGRFLSAPYTTDWNLYALAPDGTEKMGLLRSAARDGRHPGDRSGRHRLRRLG